MRYLPHTEEDISAMLRKVGMASMDDLFASVPNDCRRKDEMDIADPMTEWELNYHANALAEMMAVSPQYKIFMGAGSYDHYIPATVSHLSGRSEFYTAYTPYQPEISQGTLQAIYEYQTLTCRLLGMEVANASMYDGASALAEALLMAIRIKKTRKKVAVSSLIHPLYRRVVQTYFNPTDYEIIELPRLENGRTHICALTAMNDLAAVAIQSPNFFGCIEDLKSAGEMIHQNNALFVACFSEPLAYGLLKNPGSLGADIACGEGQSLGIPRTFGGPGLGMFATRTEFVRNMPGRLIGQTKDKNGKRGFVLTLATREQHIRREKATSNICSNQGLCATTSAMYMASLGRTGMKELAKLNYDKAEYLKRELKQAGFEIPYTAPTFNEFVVKFPNEKYEALLDKKIVAGLPLAEYYPESENHYLLCVTETISRQDMDILVKELRS
jgi:glycine dehydrogenase subunit 1